MDLAMAAHDPLVYLDGHDRRRVNTVKAAEIAGVSTRTIYNWMRLGWVEYARTSSGGVRIYADTLFQRDPRGRRPKS